MAEYVKYEEDSPLAKEVQFLKQQIKFLKVVVFILAIDIAIVTYKFVMNGGLN